MLTVMRYGGNIIGDSMNKRDENKLIKYIQRYVNHAYNKIPYIFRKYETCSICKVFYSNNSYIQEEPGSSCKKCPLYINNGKCIPCTFHPTYIHANRRSSATVPEMRARLKYILKQFKKFGLNIEIVEEYKI